MKKFIVLLPILLTLLCCKKGDHSKIEKQTEQQVLLIAQQWTEAWNGAIDLDRMMALHHKDLKYYWHGKAMTFEGFKDVLSKYVIGVETYNHRLINPEVTVLDKDNAVVGFQLLGESQDPKTVDNAFTLVITKVKSEWKIIHIHEG